LTWRGRALDAAFVEKSSRTNVHVTHNRNVPPCHAHCDDASYSADLSRGSPSKVRDKPNPGWPSDRHRRWGNRRYITEVGIDDGQAIVIGEIVRTLGIGYDAVAIPMEMFANKDDHVELAITAEQVRSRLERPEQ
jgi:hypothetical protein